MHFYKLDLESQLVSWSRADRKKERALDNVFSNRIRRWSSRKEIQWNALSRVWVDPDGWLTGWLVNWLVARLEKFVGSWNHLFSTNSKKRVSLFISECVFFIFLSVFFIHENSTNFIHNGNKDSIILPELRRLKSDFFLLFPAWICTNWSRKTVFKDSLSL